MNRIFFFHVSSFRKKKKCDRSDSVCVQSFSHLSSAVRCSPCYLTSGCAPHKLQVTQTALVELQNPIPELSLRE